MESGIKRLLKLYDLYDEIEELVQIKSISINKEKVYKEAQRFSFISGVTNKKELLKNEEKLEKLKEEKRELLKRNDLGDVDLDSFQIERMSKSKKRLIKLRRQRLDLVLKKEAIENDFDIADKHRKEDFNALLEFFPQANIKHIEEIDAFHKNLNNVLGDELREKIDKTKIAIACLDDEIENLEQELAEIKGIPNVSIAILESYSKIEKQIYEISSANEFYQNKILLHKDVIDNTLRLESLLAEKTNKLQININKALEKFNGEIYEDEVTPPILNIINSKKYTYKIERDSGTGSKIRGLLLFDYVILSQTFLPILVEDSMTIKQVEDKTVLNIFKLFNSQSKQVFVAIDKGESYSENHEIPNILKETTVLSLSEGHELFGMSWNKRKKDS